MNDIYRYDNFLKQLACEWLIDKIESSKEFTPSVPEDEYKTNDVLIIPTTEPSIVPLQEEIYRSIKDVKDLIENIWRIKLELSEESCYTFVAKYSVGASIDRLKEHTDSSDITISVKLNNNYKGCELIFPRQGVSNKNVPVGSALIFPGGLTHPHYCTPIEEGTKYTLTTWLTHLGPKSANS